MFYFIGVNNINTNMILDPIKAYIFLLMALSISKKQKFY